METRTFTTMAKMVKYIQLSLEGEFGMESGQLEDFNLIVDRMKGIDAEHKSNNWGVYINIEKYGATMSYSMYEAKEIANEKETTKYYLSVYGNRKSKHYEVDKISLEHFRKYYGR